MPRSSSTSLILPRLRRKTSTNPSCSRLRRARGPASKRPSTDTPQLGHSRRRISIAVSQLGHAPTKRAMVTSLLNGGMGLLASIFVWATGPSFDGARPSAQARGRPADHTHDEGTRPAVVAGGGAEACLDELLLGELCHEIVRVHRLLRAAD